MKWTDQSNGNVEITVIGGVRNSEGTDLSISIYRGSSSNTVFWAPREGVLEENSVGGGIFKYYLLVRRAPLYFQSTFVHLFLNEGTSVINGKKHFELALLARRKGIHQFLLKTVNCLQYSVYVFTWKRKGNSPNSILKL